MHCCHVLFRVIRCCCSPFFSHSSFGPSTAICAARFELSARPHLFTCILMDASFPCHAVRICLALEFSFVFLLAQNSSHGLLYARWGPDYFFGRVGRPASAWAAAATLLRVAIDRSSWLQMRVRERSGTAVGRFSVWRARAMCELKCLARSWGRGAGRRQRHWWCSSKRGCRCVCTSGRGQRRVGSVGGGQLSCAS